MGREKKILQPKKKEKNIGKKSASFDERVVKANKYTKKMRKNAVNECWVGRTLPPTLSCAKDCSFFLVAGGN